MERAVVSVSIHRIQEAGLLVDNRITLENPRIIDLITLGSEVAECFDLGDLEGYEERPLIPELVRLPYSLCWFEGTIAGSDGKKLHFALMASHSTIEREDDSIVMSMLYRSANKQWIYEGGALIDISAGLTFRVLEGSEALREQILHMVQVLFVFLSALNCCNIRRECIEPPERLQKARVKRGKKRLHRHWVLKIDLDRSSTSGSRAAASGRASPAFHLRIGHFRKLADGRYIWVHPHAVGNTANGLVTKTYRVA